MLHARARGDRRLRSIKDYDRFLKAWDNGEFNRLVVVPEPDPVGDSLAAREHYSSTLA